MISWMMSNVTEFCWILWRRYRGQLDRREWEKLSGKNKGLSENNDNLNRKILTGRADIM